MFSNRLSQLSFDAMIMTFNGDRRVRRLKMVKWAALEYSPDQYQLFVDSLTLPRGRGLTEDAMSKPEIVRSLGLTAQKPVYANYQEGVGLIFCIDRDNAVGNVPRFCDYQSVIDQALTKEKLSPIRFPIGFTGGRKPAMLDFSDDMTSHLLVAGTSGGGKSSLLHLIICYLIQQDPRKVKLSLFDFKRVELTAYYDHVPHLRHAIVTNPSEFLPAVAELRREVERRYKYMAEAHVEHIKEWNQSKPPDQRMPDIFFVVDELASLYVNPEIPKNERDEIDGHLGFIAMQARACGVHLILATQRPSADVLSGYIRACMPCKIAYACASVTESTIILGTGDAAFKDQVPVGRALITKGRWKIQFQTAWISKPVRREIAQQAGSTEPGAVQMTAPDAPPDFKMPLTVQEFAQYALENLNGIFNQRKLYAQFRTSGASDYGLRAMSAYYQQTEFELAGERYILKADAPRRPIKIEKCRELGVGNDFDHKRDSISTPDHDGDIDTAPDEFYQWAMRMRAEVGGENENAG